jgi:AraC-like DNA-binding protein
MRIDFLWHAHGAYELVLLANVSDHPGPVGFRWRVGAAEGFDAAPAAFLIAPGIPHAFWTDGFLPHGQVIGANVAWWDPALTALPAVEAWAPVRALLERSSCGVVVFGAAAAEAVARSAGEATSPTRRAALILELLAILAADGGRDCNATALPPLDVQRDLERLTAVEAVLIERYREPLTLPWVATRCGMSVSGLNALLKRHRRATFLDVLNRVRVERAKEAMVRRRDDITAIALGCGFGSIATFNRRFRRYVGVSPQVWRAEHR